MTKSKRATSLERRLTMCPTVVFFTAAALRRSAFRKMSVEQVTRSCIPHITHRPLIAFSAAGEEKRLSPTHWTL